MRIYVPRPLEGIELVSPVDRASREALRTADGTPRATTWTPPRVSIMAEYGHRRFARSAMPWLVSPTPVLRKEARAVVEQLPGSFELLPLDCDDTELWVLNATLVLDGALDEAATELRRIPSGKVIAIKHPVFCPDVVADVPIFRLEQQPGYAVYVNETWATRLGALENVAFELAWADEANENGSVL